MGVCDLDCPGQVGLTSEWLELALKSHDFCCAQPNFGPMALSCLQDRAGYYLSCLPGCDVSAFACELDRAGYLGLTSDWLELATGVWSQHPRECVFFRLKAAIKF